MSEQGRRNRRLVAERTGWPVDAVAVCEKLEARYPGWTVWWDPAAARFAARHLSRRRPARAHGDDAESLAASIRVLEVLHDAELAERRRLLPPGWSLLGE